MAGKRQRLAILGARLEVDARNFRLAAEEIRAIVETLPRSRFKAQRLTLEQICRRLDRHAEDLETEVAAPDPPSVELLGRLGRERAVLAFTALGALSSTGSLALAVTDNITAAQQAVTVAYDCSDELARIASWAGSSVSIEPAGGGDDELPQLEERRYGPRINPRN